jgi:hypothetical protein
LNQLRSQIRKDSVASGDLRMAQLARAANLMDALAVYGAAIPEIPPIITTLRKTVIAFYTDSAHRGWAQQFAVQDIDKLEALYPEER